MQETLKNKGKMKMMFMITKGNFGGAQRYVYDLSRKLKADFDISVCLGTKNGSILKDKLEQENIKTIELTNSMRDIKITSDIKSLVEIIKIIKKERPDFIHFNSSKIGFLGSVAILFLKIINIFKKDKIKFRSIFTIHGFAFKEESRNIFSKILFLLFYYFIIIICDKTIAVSEKTKRNISRFSLIRNKIEVIHNGIENFIEPNKQKTLIKKEENDIILFTIAELHRNKALNKAILGISDLPNELKNRIKYYIAGEGEERENLTKLINELKLNANIFLLGFIDDARQLINESDIFLFTSINENLPYVILEAGYSKTPIISTSVGGIPEIINDMENGILIHPNNSKEITEAIIYAVNNKEQLNNYSENLKQIIINKFSLEQMISKTTALYNYLFK